jgi:hypothetical protein
VRGVRRRLWKMEMDNGVVRDVIKAGMRLFIGNLPPPPRKFRMVTDDKIYYDDLSE